LPLSRALVTLKDDMAIDFDLERARVDVHSLPAEAMLAMFRELGFNRYPDELEKIVGSAAVAGAKLQTVTTPAVAPRPLPAPSEGESAFADSLFAPSEPGAPEGTLAAPAATPSDPGEYACIMTVDELDRLIERMRRCHCIAIDTETDSLS